MKVLKAAQQSGALRMEEVALYGAQIHAVVPDAKESAMAIRSLLEREQIEVIAIERIAPTLEDVFISSVTAPVAQAAS